MSLTGHYSPLPCCQILPRFQFEISPIFPKPLQCGSRGIEETPQTTPLASKSPLRSHWEPLMVSRRDPLPPVLLFASDYLLWILLLPSTSANFNPAVDKAITPLSQSVIFLYVPVSRENHSPFYMHLLILRSHHPVAAFPRLVNPPIYIKKLVSGGTRVSNLPLGTTFQPTSGASDGKVVATGGLTLQPSQPNTARCMQVMQVCCCQIPHLAPLSTPS